MSWAKKLSQNILTFNPSLRFEPLNPVHVKVLQYDQRGRGRKHRVFHVYERVLNKIFHGAIFKELPKSSAAFVNDAKAQNDKTASRYYLIPPKPNIGIGDAKDNLKITHECHNQKHHTSKSLKSFKKPKTCQINTNWQISHCPLLETKNTCWYWPSMGYQLSFSTLLCLHEESETRCHPCSWGNGISNKRIHARLARTSLGLDNKRPFHYGEKSLWCRQPKTRSWSPQISFETIEGSTGQEVHIKGLHTQLPYLAEWSSLVAFCHDVDLDSYLNVEFHTVKILN